MNDLNTIRLEEAVIKIVDNRGKTPPLSKVGIPLIEANAISLEHRWVQESLIGKYVSEETYNSWFRSGHPEPGDVLIVTVGSTGQLCQLKKNKGAIAQNIVALRPNPKLFNTDYFYYYTSSPLFQKQVKRVLMGAVQPSLKVTHMTDFLITQPSLDEQHKIAEILGTWDEAIEEVEKLINKTRTFKLTLLYTHIHKQSEKQRLSNIMESVTILDNKRRPLNDSQRKVMQGNIAYYGANGQVDSISDFIFDEPLILLAEDGGHFDEYTTRPIAYKIEGKSWVNNHAHVLRVKPGYDHNFIFYSLEHKNITKMLNGGTRAKLNRGELEKITLWLPEIDKQKEIGLVFKIVDEKIELLNKKLSLIKAQKTGLMQKLLTGQIRVS